MKSKIHLSKNVLLILLFIGNLVLWTGCEKDPSADNNNNIVMGSMTDARGNQTYATLTVGGQTWLAENLRIPSLGSFENPNNPSNAYGRLYHWNAAKSSCPHGWHLPTEDEWKTLEISLGMSASDADLTSTYRGTIGGEMKSTTGWSANGNGTNSTGFNVFPTGYYNESDSTFGGLGDFTKMWTFTGFSGGSSKSRSFAASESGIRQSTATRLDGHACRCVQDDNPPPSLNITTGSMTDARDSETYTTMTLDGQTWMAENLRYNATGSWENPSNPSSTYGRLYDFATANNACPSGWHLPSDQEWKTFEINLGVSPSDADLSSAFRGSYGGTVQSTTGWKNNANGSNTTGFNAVPAGYYNENHVAFYNLEIYANFWSSTGHGGASAWRRTFAYGYSGVNRNSTSRSNGQSCRCIED